MTGLVQISHARGSKRTGISLVSLRGTLIGMSNCDQPSEQFGADTRIAPSYNKGVSSSHPGFAWRRVLGGRINMLWTIFVVLMIMWLLGFSFHVGGGLIHLLLVVAVIWLVWNLLTRRRSFS